MTPTLALFAAGQRDMLDRIGIDIAPTDPIRVETVETWHDGRCLLTATLFESPDADLFQGWMESLGWEWQTSECTDGGPVTVTWVKYRPRPLTDKAARLRMARYRELVTRDAFARASAAMVHSREAHEEAGRAVAELSD